MPAEVKLCGLKPLHGRFLRKRVDYTSNFRFLEAFLILRTRILSFLFAKNPQNCLNRGIGAVKNSYLKSSNVKESTVRQIFNFFLLSLQFLNFISSAYRNFHSIWYSINQIDSFWKESINCI